MTHVAIQERLDGRVEWMEHVTNNQYHAGS
jgi:hypothetical protein